MYSSGSETNLFLVLLLPTPLAATFSQKRFKTDGLIMKQSLVVGPKHALTNGNITPICREYGSICLHAGQIVKLKTFMRQTFLPIKIYIECFLIQFLLRALLSLRHVGKWQKSSRSVRNLTI